MLDDRADDKSGQSSAAHSAHKPQSVLAIDDTQDIHDLLRVRLRSEGIDLFHANGAEEGIRRAKEVSPDLILLDIDMPKMNGFDVCRELKAHAPTASIPIIFLSAASDVMDKVAGFDLGAVDFVTKPFNTAELRARVRAALRTKRYQDMLEQRAQIDGLTGLWNRGYFNQRLADEVAAAKRYEREVSLVLVDLDFFKKLNDGHGHPFGDRVLQATGEVLASTVRATDAACRYGGEEFALILTETPSDGARICAERVRELLEKLNLISKGKPVPVTASLGFACASAIAKDLLSPQTLLDAADGALYAAKQGGRNRVCEAAAVTGA
jgi:two-component system, cell cycle response regulator